MLAFLLAFQVATTSADSVYATSALRELVARAAAANAAAPSELRGYTSHIETEMSLMIRDTLGREHTAEVEQLATQARWSRTGTYELHVVGYRSQSVGVPYSTLSIVRGWTVPTLYGNRLSLGAYFARSNTGDTLVAVHPFANDRDQYYRFSGGDTVTTLQIAGRRIPIVRIRTHPHFRSRTRLGAFDGEIDVDADRAQIVRMRGQVVVLGQSERPSLAQRALGVVAAAYVEFVNAEIAGRYWLPAFQRTEFQASIALLGQSRPIYRLVSRVSDIAVDEAEGLVTAADTPRVVVTWAPSDSVSTYRDWQAGIGEQTQSVHSDDFIDMAPDAWRTFGPPRLMLFPNDIARVLRFNRVEGLFTGVAPTIDFRSVVPGLRVGAHAGYAWTEQTIRGGVFADYTRGPSALGIRAERQLVSTNDFVPPLSEDPGFGALLSSVDDYDYVDRRTALLSWVRMLRSLDVGLVTLQAGVGDDCYDRARLTHGLFGSSRFRANRGVDAGSYAISSLDLELHPNVTGEYVQPGVGLRAHYEAAAGTLAWQRVELGLSHRAYIGPVSLASHVDAGLVTASGTPPQQLFELGGIESLPGYDYKAFAGNRAALARTFASYRFPVLRRPMRVWRNFFVPGLSPGLGVSAQGGWAELSNTSARLAALRLGIVNGQPVSQPTNGFRATVGGGLTFLADAVHVGIARPVDHAAPWRLVVGFGTTF
jgi:hypothetical protein